VLGRKARAIRRVDGKVLGHNDGNHYPLYLKSAQHWETRGRVGGGSKS